MQFSLRRSFHLVCLRANFNSTSKFKPRRKKKNPKAWHWLIKEYYLRLSLTLTSSIDNYLESITNCIPSMHTFEAPIKTTISTKNTLLLTAFILWIISRTKPSAHLAPCRRPRTLRRWRVPWPSSSQRRRHNVHVGLDRRIAVLFKTE